MNIPRKYRILLAEDDPNLSSVLADYFELLGYECNVAPDGESGIHLFNKQQFDLCVLDVMMPRKDGFTLACEIREKDKTTPIIFLTAKGLEEDRIKGFRLGCDDYIIKPFSSEELSLRIEAVLRRCYTPKEESIRNIFPIGIYAFDIQNRILDNGVKKQKLTHKEASLLQLLCENKNTLVTRENALKKIWGSNDYFLGRSMDVFIARLRKYLKEDSSINLITMHGIGFLLEIPENNLSI